MATQQDTVDSLLQRHGTTYAEEAHITLRDKPQPLFRLLVLTHLLAARIGAGIAVATARAVSAAGWRSPQMLADADWDRRIRVLTDGGYTRYRERTATQLVDLSEEVLDRWDGDLRALREDADRDPAAIRERLEAFKGVGPTGVEVFAREAQAVWPELAPVFDGPAKDGARRAGLPQDPAKLARLVEPAELPRLAAALVRHGLDG